MKMKMKMKMQGVDKLLTRAMHKKDIRNALVGLIIMIDNGCYDNKSISELIKDIGKETKKVIGELT